MMKNCPNCGSELAADEKVCPVCGYVLQQKIPRGDVTKAQEVEGKVGAFGEGAIASTTEANETAKVTETAGTVEPTKSLESTGSAEPTESTNSAEPTRTTTAKKTTRKPELTVLAGGKDNDEADFDEDGPTPWDHVLGYFRSLNGQVLAPNFNQIGPTSQAEKWYGVASFLIIVLSNAFALSRLLTGLIYRVLGMIQSFGLQLEYQGSNLLFFFELALYLAVVGGVYVLAYYLVAGKVFGRPLGFFQALGELLAPASLAVYLSLAAAVLALVLSDTPNASLTMVVASLLLLSVSFIGNLWQTPNLTGRFNRFYTILLINLACLLVLVLVSRFFLTGMMQDLPIQQVPTGIEDIFGESDLFY